MQTLQRLEPGLALLLLREQARSQRPRNQQQQVPAPEQLLLELELQGHSQRPRNPKGRVLERLELELGPGLS